jgi:phospholipid/cholesterol/gamma-HCH transport system substrate-binding protein
MPDEVLVEVEIDQNTPVTVDTTAVLVPQGVTGLLVVELRGGDPNAPKRAADDGLPQIAGRVSAIEQVFTSTPELLARGVAVMERVTSALSQENIARLATAMANLEEVTTTIAGRSAEIDQLLVAGGTLGTDAQSALASLDQLLDRAERLTVALEGQLTTISGSGAVALDEVAAAAAAARNLAWRADRVLAESEQPLQDFGSGGLYEFSEMVREVRILVAALSRIATDFERDPAGFLIGGSQRGFTPQ